MAYLSPTIRPRPTRFAVVVSGKERPITEHGSISDCLHHIRDALKQGATRVSVTRLTTRKA
jgi:hypothetical protein